MAALSHCIYGLETTRTYDGDLQVTNTIYRLGLYRFMSARVYFMYTMSAIYVERRVVCGHLKGVGILISFTG